MKTCLPSNFKLILGITTISLAIFFSACETENDAKKLSKDVITPSVYSASAASEVFKSQKDTSRFLGRATFGARQADIEALTGTDVSAWLKAEFAKPETPYLAPLIKNEETRPKGLEIRVLADHFYDAAIAADDQLRQRMIFALSQIVVASSASGLIGRPLAMADYAETLSNNAFGNYRDLLEEITYTPAMAIYLTYMTNRKGDAASGRVPDENYAREILQLFSVGLYELNPDGTLKKDENNNPIELYGNEDIKGLARVFTGMSTQGTDFFRVNEADDATYKPLKFYPEWHSPLEKKFLDVTIPAGTSGEESLQMALDGIFAHPNVGPFVSKQLIQRFVTSNPTPNYVERVSSAFNKGSFKLPDGSIIGTGERGDLKATISAILLDPEALIDTDTAPDGYGKIREPIIRLTNWARAFNVTKPDTSDEAKFNATGIEQSPFTSPSVFNFFRPGYVAPSTTTGDADLSAPELQITNETTTIGYINFINQFIYERSYNFSKDNDAGIKADYSEVLEIADNVDALIDYLDLVLTAKSLTAESRARISTMMEQLPIRPASEDKDRMTRVRLATSMVMTDPGYMVQR